MLDVDRSCASGGAIETMLAAGSLRNSAERYDFREESWINMPSFKESREFCVAVATPVVYHVE